MRFAQHAGYRSAQIETKRPALERYRDRKETENFNRIPDLDQLIQHEFNWAENAEKEKSKHHLKKEADELFRAIIKSIQ